MNMKNIDPFYRLGEYIFGERFVGRDKDVEELQTYCSSRNYAIIGMPRIGKTSLAYHSIVENKSIVESKMFSDKKLCVVFFDVPEHDKAEKAKFFKDLVEECYNDLEKVIDDDKREELVKAYNKQKEKDFELSSIHYFFKSIKDYGVVLVIVFDEFDRVKRMEFKSAEFGLLRNIVNCISVKGILVSRRGIDVLENWCEESAGSNFYQCFSQRFLSGFDKDSLEKYWERLTPYFKEKGINIDNDYISKAEYYAGNHPHLLDIYNSNKLSDHKDEVDKTIRIVFDKQFTYIINVLDELELLKIVQQAILGPVLNVDIDKIFLLEKYGILKKVPIAKKEKLLRGNFGFTENKEYGYIAFSDYFTLYLRNKFINNFDFWPIWSETFQKLRGLVEKFFVCNWGDDWEQNNDFPDNIMCELENGKEKDERSNINPSPLMQYLDESKLHEIFDVFWETFKIVFEQWTKYDFFERYEFLHKIRNHHGHYNKDYLSCENIKKADLYLEEISNKLNSWFCNCEKELKILNDKCGEGIIEKKNNYLIIKNKDRQICIDPKYSKNYKNLKEGDCVVYKYEYYVNGKYLYAYDIKKKKGDMCLKE